MEKYIVGTYKQSIFQSDNGYIIGLFKVKDTDLDDMKEYINKTITFTGYFHELNETENYYFKGESSFHPKYGFQFNVKEYERVKPEDKDGIVAFLCSDLFKGVGEKLATNIVDTLGDDALNIIIQDKSSLLLVPKMTTKKADNIYNTLVKYEESHKIIVYLTELGFSMRDALLIYNTYKKNTQLILENNIYRVIDDIEEIRFPKVDLIVKSKDFGIDEDLRVKACTYYIMQELTFKNGDTYLNIDEIYEGVCQYLGYSIEYDYLDSILAELNGDAKVMIVQDKYYLQDIYDAQYNIVEKIKSYQVPP